MGIWETWTEKLGLRRTQSPKDILQAHLEALLEDPLAAPPSGNRLSLPMADAPGPRCLVLQLGLSRLEAYLEHNSVLRFETSGDALLLQVLPDETCCSLLAQLKFGFHPKAGVLQGRVNVSTRKQRQTACSVLERVLVDLLENQAGGHYSVAIERQLKPDNRALVAQIKRLVLKRDMESRRLVYQSIVQGVFYLPVQTDNTPHCPPQPAPWKLSDNGRPVWAIFSSADNLPKDAAKAYILVSGIRLVQAAHAHDIGGLLLNPGLEFGGELYRHELDSLGDYLRTLGMMKFETKTSGAVH